VCGRARIAIDQPAEGRARHLGVEQGFPQNGREVDAASRCET